MILIAGRDQNVRELRQFFLEKAGFDVAFADAGEAALERAPAARPHRPGALHPPRVL